jgi:VanZ family protein
MVFKYYRQNYLKILFWLALIALFILSSIPELPVQTTAESSDTSFRFDYLFHFLAYAALGVLYVMAYTPTLKGFFLIMIYAAAEEAHQFFIPGRTLNPVDWGFDVAGLFLVLLIWIVLKKDDKGTK